MSALAQVHFEFSLRVRSACVREPTGLDEEALEGRSTLAAIRYLDRVLVDAPGVDVRPGDARTLTAPERDTLLAALHRLVFGDRIEGSPRCARCNEIFDLEFDLGALEQNARHECRRPTAAEREEGAFHGPGGVRFRLPTGEEECRIVGLEPQVAEAALAEVCCPDGARAVGADALGDMMRRVAPVLADDVVAVCPGCDHAMSLHFDIQSFHLDAMERARVTLPDEVDRLARSYGWSLQEILALSRSRRRAYVAVATGMRRSTATGVQ